MKMVPINLLYTAKVEDTGIPDVLAGLDELVEQTTLLSKRMNSMEAASTCPVHHQLNDLNSEVVHAEWEEEEPDMHECRGDGCAHLFARVHVHVLV